MIESSSTAELLNGANEPARPMRILVIDDNELDRQRLVRLCGKAGLRFDAVQVEGLSGLEDALSGDQFDIIFIDYFLGGDTGLEALEIITAHEQNRKSASIMLAGEGQISIAVEAMRQGCADYMTKSMMNVDTLQKSIATALERQLMSETLADADFARMEFEESVKAYAKTATAEMRAILSATLRRVRKLRVYKTERNVEYAIDLHSLETDIDRLWDALPDLNGAPQISSETAQQTKLPPTRH